MMKLKVSALYTMMKPYISGLLPTLDSGTYTPTLTAVTNIAGSTAYVCQYLRIGAVVVVSGVAGIACTSSSGLTELGISLPIASNIASINNIGGSGAASNSLGALLMGNSTNDRVRFMFTTNYTSSRTWSFIFSYKII